MGVVYRAPRSGDRGATRRGQDDAPVGSWDRDVARGTDWPLSRPKHARLGLLTHPNIVVVFDAGEEEGIFYITMELVEGAEACSLLLDAQQVFPLPRIVKLMETSLFGARFSRTSANVVHRDNQGPQT